jgi:Dolichyl-phosphate-mannose-protein mannosyltransferase
VKQFLWVAALALALRLPFLHQPVQGDDLYYLYGAEHAQIEPLHPAHTHYLFLGDWVDMRGQSHPPLNSWILAGLLALEGVVREGPFHLAYAIFSGLAAAAMWSLARRFSTRPALATLLFCAAPAFVINGNSLEADLPFLAFWMAAIALFVIAVDRASYLALLASAAASALAALAAYQAVFLTPILAIFLWRKRPQWSGTSLPGWVAVCAAPATLAAWQIWERAATGALPASVLAGYLHSYDFESLKRKMHAAVALIVHLGWIVSPLIVFGAIWKSRSWQWVVAIAAALGAAIFNPNPLFWISFACGAWLLVWCLDKGWLGWWVVIFFASAAAVFFVGSARYLLPVAAPLAILLAEAVPPRLAAAGFVLQLSLALTLAAVNYRHWSAYRDFANNLSRQTGARRVWINADWGLRWYLEDQGGLPLAKNQLIQPGDIVVTSELANPLPAGAPLGPLTDFEISPRIPLRLISLSGRSAYSAGSGFLPFEISRGPIDRVRAEIAIEPRLGYLNPRDPAAASQIVSGLSPDGWMSGEAKLLLKAPVQAGPLEISFYVPDNAPARHLRVSMNGVLTIDKQIPGPGLYTASTSAASVTGSVVVALAVDKTFSVPGDARALGLVIQGVGFR